MNNNFDLLEAQIEGMIEQAIFDRHTKPLIIQKFAEKIIKKRKAVKLGRGQARTPKKTPRKKNDGA